MTDQDDRNDHELGTTNGFTPRPEDGRADQVVGLVFRVLISALLLSTLFFGIVLAVKGIHWALNL